MPTKYLLPFVVAVAASFSIFADEPESAKPNLAPGGLTTIPPSIDFEDIARRQDIPELLKNVPEPDDVLKDDIRFQKETWAKEIRYNSDIWCLQFSFKPVRIIEVEIPNKDGKLDKKAVWYLVYNVKNLGKSEISESGDIKKVNSWLGSAVYQGDELTLPVSEDKMLDGTQRTDALDIRNIYGQFVPTPGSDKPIQFQPQFDLTIHKLVKETKVTNNPDTGKTEYQTETANISYKDRVIPLALPLIIRREGMKSIPETTVSFPSREIAAGQDYWGVAMWTDIDPRVNEFSIYVAGLTNAYQQFDDNEANAGIAGQGRILKRKVLKTDWQRLGDRYSLSETQIRFGALKENVKKDIFELKGDYNQDGKVDQAEAKRYFDVLMELGKTDAQQAVTQHDGINYYNPRILAAVYVNDFERSEYNRIHQEWLQPSYGYGWRYL